MIYICAAVLTLTVLLTVPAFAITEAEVEAQVSAQGKEAVAGNVLIWFLCAVAFLKVSQKIDSFLSSLGVNVGRTGGSLLSEAMIAARSITTIAGATGHSFGGGGRKGGGGSGSAGSTGGAGFLKGGLAGVVSRKITNDAVKTATTSNHASSAAHTTTTNSATGSAAHTHTGTNSQSASATKTSRFSSQTQHTNASAAHATTQRHTGLGGAIFANSLRSGGQFANDVIGKVARGDIRSTGSITGSMADQALSSYMGHTALGDGAHDIPAYSNVEIGGGRITGTETSPEHPEGISFGMYHSEQYQAPEGAYSKVHSADGTMWYCQYAVDTVSKTPFKAPDGEIDYHKELVKKLPDPPKRKDRM